jgi:hypothetical protein
MRKSVPYRLLIAAVALTWSVAGAHADDGYLLKRVYKAGDSEKFKTTLKIQSGSEDGNPAAKLEVTILGSETVKEVKADGSTVLEMKVEKSTVNFGGQERELPGSGQTTTTVIGKDGQIIPDKKTAGASGGVNPSQMLAFIRPLTFPDKALKAGDEHKFETKSTEDGKPGQSVKGVMTVVSFEKKDAELPADAVKVKMVVDATVPGQDGMSTQNIHVDGHTWIEPGTGRTVLTTGNVTGIKIPTFGDATVEFKRVRVGASSESKAEAVK